jgi:hypothetical protein
MIGSAVVVATYYYITDAMCNTSFQYQLLRTFLVIFGMFMSLTSVITAIKHRFFRAVWLAERARIEAELKLKPIPMCTEVVANPGGKNHFGEIWSVETMLILSLPILAMPLSY